MAGLHRIDTLPPLPRRPLDAHKGDAGRVVVIAGSRGMSGAGILTGLGALRSGAGLVRVLTPLSVQPIVASAEPSLMTVGLEETATGQVAPADLANRVAEQLAWADVVAVGPGLGRSASKSASQQRSPDAEPADALRLLLEQLIASDKPLVIDADGLNLLADVPELLANDGPLCSRVHPTVVTPHPGEMARLCAGLGLSAAIDPEEAARIQCATEFAQRTNCVTVLKGRGTVVCDANRYFVNPTGNPGMATGGMGDVLTGIVAALIGQGCAPLDAAIIATTAHGAAADVCAAEIGPVGYLAHEVADELPAVLGELRQAAWDDAE